MYIITHCCESPLHWMGLGGAGSLWCLPRQPDPSSKATFFSSLQKINAASVGAGKKNTHTQKPPFPVVLELEARHDIMLGALGSQVCVHQEVRQFGPLQCEAA